MRRDFLRRLIWAAELSLVLAFALASASALAGMPAIAQSRPSPESQKLDVSVGRWVFHGTSKTKTGKTQPFTWNENCAWSPNHLYLECTFSNVWAGRAVESLVVDAYNTTDHSYWHYEFYSGGEKGDHPFVSRMDVSGNTWIEYGQQTIPGKKAGERIVYKWDPPNRVSVAIETSKDGVHWSTVDQGEGTKQQ